MSEEFERPYVPLKSCEGDGLLLKTSEGPIHTIYVFPGGYVAALNESGEQIPAIQGRLDKLLLDLLRCQEFFE